MGTCRYTFTKVCHPLKLAFYRYLVPAVVSVKGENSTKLNTSLLKSINEKASWNRTADRPEYEKTKWSYFSQRIQRSQACSHGLSSMWNSFILVAFAYTPGSQQTFAEMAHWKARLRNISAKGQRSSGPCLWPGSRMSPEFSGRRGGSLVPSVMCCMWASYCDLLWRENWRMG